MRTIVDINKGWRFAFGHPGDFRRDFEYGVEGMSFAKSGSSAAPVTIKFDDQNWSEVDLPHDWTVKLPPVYSNTHHMHVHGYKPFGIEFPDYCVGWYRKIFFVPDEYKNKRVFFEFDGAFRSMQLWINGVFVARNESGYIGDRYDISEMLYFDKENIITARLEATVPEGWFYEGCGIYRPVRLIVTDNINIKDTETFVKSTLVDNTAQISVDTMICNDSDSDSEYSLTVSVLDGNNTVASAVSKGTVSSYDNNCENLTLTLNDPKLWSTEEPNLYTVNIKVTDTSGRTDEYSVETGIKTVVFDTDKGVFLNGKKIKIKGVCCHQDHAGVGSAITEPLYEYRLKLLKQVGVNAYRCSHNPPSPELLRLCDRMGLLVMDENRLLSTGPEYISQVERLVKRDRNHPCIFVWSIANEEGGIQGNEVGGNMGKKLVRLFHKLDPTRPTIYAGNNGECDTGTNVVTDLRGWNYMNIGGIEAMDRTHVKHPEQPILGTEDGSTVTTRGKYFDDKERGYVSAYGENFPGWGASAEHWWSNFAVRDYLLGSFVWTGFDYRGESTPYQWPNISSHFGIMDICGFPKDLYYYYKANWTDEDVLHICPHWNINVAEGTPVKVKCFTNCESVELFLNGKNVGKTDVEKYQSAYFTVPYEKGILKAIGYRNGKQVECVIETADDASCYEISSESCENKEEKITIFTVEAKDSKGRFNASCDDTLSIEASDGTVIGVGNGDPSDHECDLITDRCRLFGGLMSVIVRSAPDQTPSISVNKI